MSDIANRPTLFGSVAAQRFRDWFAAARGNRTGDKQLSLMLEEFEVAIDESLELLQSPGGYMALEPLTELLAKWRKRISQGIH